MDRYLSLDELRCLLDNYAVSKLPIGIIGFGTFGKQIKQILTLWNMETEVCDPPLAENESEEEMDSLMELWGNGMGGCCYSGSEKEIFLPF